MTFFMIHLIFSMNQIQVLVSCIKHGYSILFNILKPFSHTAGFFYTRDLSSRSGLSKHSEISQRDIVKFLRFYVSCMTSWMLHKLNGVIRHISQPIPTDE